MVRTAILMLGLLGPLVGVGAPAGAQAISPNVPLGQPVNPQDSDILRRSQRDAAPPPPATGPSVSQPGAGQPGALGGLVQPDGRIVITREMCAQQSIQHRPAPDVAYRPGTDVYGRPVAPADLPGSGSNQYGLGDRTSTDLLIRPQGQVPGRAGVIGETYVGRVTTDSSGRTFINGQPVDGQGQSELQQLCRQAGYLR
jgi:hypothetical protein